MTTHTECRAFLTGTMKIRQAFVDAKGNNPDYVRLANGIAQHDGEQFSPSGLAIMVHDLMGQLTAQGCDLADLSGDIGSLVQILMDGLTITADNPDLPFRRQLDFALCEQFIL